MITNDQFWFGLFMGIGGFIVGFWQVITGVTYSRYSRYRPGRIYRTDNPTAFWLNVGALWVLSALLIAVAAFDRPAIVTFPRGADLFMIVTVILGFMAIMWLRRRD
jgi:hypothetical protein